MTGSDMVADEVDGADEVVGGSGSVRGGEIQMFRKLKGLMGWWGGNPLASPISGIGSSWISTPVLICRGGSSPMRSTNLTLLALGAAMGFTDLLFPASGAAAGLGELNNKFLMGAGMEVVFGSGVD